MSRALEWLLAAPWRLVVVVALVVGLPIVLIGEVSAADARERIRTSELRLTADGSARAADIVGTQLATIRVQLTGLAADVNVKRAAEEGDRDALASLTHALRSVMSRDVRRLVVLDGSDLVMAVEPPDPGAIGTSMRDLRVRVARPTSSYWGLLFATFSRVFVSDETGGPAVFVAAAIAGAGRAGGPSVGTVLAEIDLRFARDWLAAAHGPVEDVYVLDETGHLIAQASVPRTERNPALLRDLSQHPIVAGVSSGTSSLEAPDPLTGVRRLLAASPVTDPGWSVVLVRDAGQLEREAGAALLQLQISRLVLVAVLLAGSYLLALAGRALLRQRTALAETNAQLAKASQAKSQFLASVSHELRTPMNAILGFTDALLAGVDGPVNEEQRASLTWVQRGGQDLLALINEVLDLSKIESGKLTVTPELFLPRDLVESVCAQYRSMAAQKGLRLSWRDDGLPTEVQLDRQRTRQILVNLVGNALKFTAEGEVEIVGSTLEGRLLLAVRDTGPGIAADQLGLIFEDFRQAEGTVGGTGLGLAISRRLARIMGGDVTVTSELGRGSTFTLVLPVNMRAPAPAVPAIRAGPRRSLLLSVDDDPSVAPLLEKMLADHGYDVVGTTDPATAVADARRLQPSVITLDMLMPARDGRDVFADLRADPATRGIPIVALTVVERAEVPSGADAHLVKPIRKDRLLRTLDEVVPATLEAR